MSFRSIVRDGFGSLSRRGFESRPSSGHSKGRSHNAVHEFDERPEPAAVAAGNGRWDGLPPELLRDVIGRLEASEGMWPARRHVVACAAVCRSWREMCQEIVATPEVSGKLTFPLSLKQPGPRDTTIQCFIKRDKSNSTYRLFLCLSNSLLVENGKFLLSAKRNRRTSCTEYVISMDADKISRSSTTYIGKVRSNFLGTKFIIYDTQPPPAAAVAPSGQSSRRFSTKVSPKLPSGSFNIAQITYELNVLGTRGPRRMHCVMRSIPTSAMDPGGTVPGRPALLRHHPLADSFRSVSFSKSVGDSAEFSSSRFSDVGGGAAADDDAPLVLRNKPPRWHEQLQCWCLNFRGRVTVASVKNFQLVAAAPPPAAAAARSQPDHVHDKVILQFGKVGKDMFTMDYRYPLSAFQAFAVCLSSFDTKLACE